MVKIKENKMFIHSYQYSVVIMLRLSLLRKTFFLQAFLFNVYFNMVFKEGGRRVVGGRRRGSNEGVKLVYRTLLCILYLL